VLDLTVQFEQDTDRVIELVSRCADELRSDPDYAPLISDGLEVMGVDRFVAGGVVVKVRLKTLPQKQWTVGRELNRRIRKAFTAAGILQPMQSAVVRIENEQALTGGRPREERDALKRAVREVLAEMGGGGVARG
jgi:moderate conductance mechanosensitive channel